jgi:N6-adenosine-specific RNA methylase IME4
MSASNHESNPRRYRTIVADPPWDVKAGTASGEYKVVDGRQVWNIAPGTRTRDLAYPPMTVDEIAALDIPAADDAHLYLWTINAYVEDAYTVARAWGFRPSTLIVWAKSPFGGGGLGGTWRITTEFLLFARRGSLPATGQHVGTWFNIKREYDERGKPQHSRKPAAFLDLIEQVSPGPYLEMFARRNRLGWDTWGNEALEHVELTA